MPSLETIRRKSAASALLEERGKLSLVDAVRATGILPPNNAPREKKKAYSESLSRHLSFEVADGLRQVGFPKVKPLRGGTGEKGFQGGLGPKKVDVSYSDEQHGLRLAVSIKTICFAPFGKNLKNRFGDLCTEAITLHMRFPYSVVCALFAFPASADLDTGKRPKLGLSTVRKAIRLFATIGGRAQYTDPGEKFEDVTTMVFQPLTQACPKPQVRLIDVRSQIELTEGQYFLKLRQIYNDRNPHAIVEQLAD